MAALGVHQHRVDDVRVALPLEPEALGAAGDVGAVAALQHHALDDRVGRARRAARRARPRSRRAGAARGRSGRGRARGDERLEGGAALGEGQRAEVARAVLQQVVGAQVRRVAAELGGRDGLAVQPLLQVGEGGDRAVVAAHQQLAVERGVEVERVERGRGRRRRCRRRCASRAGAVRPRRRPGRGCRPISTRRRSRRGRACAKSASSSACDSITGRKRGGGGGRRARRRAGQPGEERDVGRAAGRARAPRSR